MQSDRTINAEMQSADFDEVAIDRVRDYWNNRPCNVRHSQKPLGSREYFDEVEARKYFVEPHIPRFAEFPKWESKRVLEIGCGIGTDTINFARHGAQVTAVDLSEASLKIAQHRAKVFGLHDRIRFYHGDAERLDQIIPVETYDLIYSFGVIHHTPHPERVFDQIRQYARPESIFKLMVYHRRSYKVLWILLTYGKGRFWRLNELVAAYSEAQVGCPVTYTYTPSEIRKQLAERQFEVTDCFVDHIFPYRIPDYVQHRYVKEWYFRWMPSSCFRALERLFGWHLCVSAKPLSNLEGANTA